MRPIFKTQYEYWNSSKVTICIQILSGGMVKEAVGVGEGVYSTPNPMLSAPTQLGKTFVPECFKVTSPRFPSKPAGPSSRTLGEAWLPCRDSSMQEESQTPAFRSHLDP